LDAAEPRGGRQFRFQRASNEYRVSRSVVRLPACSQFPTPYMADARDACIDRSVWTWIVDDESGNGFAVFSERHIHSKPMPVILTTPQAIGSDEMAQKKVRDFDDFEDVTIIEKVLKVCAR
jgi:hypothetical protein